MQDNELDFIRYWRNSLADAGLGQGSFSKKDTKKFIHITTQEFVSGHVGSNHALKLFENVSESAHTVSVILRPVLYSYRSEHGVRKNAGTPDVITPIICFLELSRDGKLFASSAPVIPRDLLEPLEAKSFSIGDIKDLDSFLSKTNCPLKEYAGTEDDCESEAYERYWKSYTTHCQSLLNEVCQDWLKNNPEFDEISGSYLNEADVLNGPSQHVIKLYDHLSKDNPKSALLSTYSCIKNKEPEPCLASNSLIPERLAHASNNFYLADAQRDALSHALTNNVGDILAVNGPPGTGKTTLLLSLVATLWAESAIKGTEPPVIFASSVNNQAVKNVIDAFGKDFAQGIGPLAGRWLPKVMSFGAYFPSRSEEDKLSSSYQTRQFFEEVENGTYVTLAEAYYLECAVKKYPELEEENINSVFDKLQEEIVRLQNALQLVEPTWNKLEKAKQDVIAEMGSTPNTTLEKLNTKLDRSESTLAAIEKYQAAWENYLTDEPIWLSLLSWLPPVKTKRDRLAFRFIRQQFTELAISPLNIHDISIRLSTRKKVSLRFNLWLKNRQARFLALLKHENDNSQRWRSLTESLLGTNNNEFVTLEACDAALDKTVRFEIFRLATHYWEGRWIEEMKNLLPHLVEEKKARGKKALEKRWRRRMKITPCVVTTLYMLPSEMAIRKRKGNGYTDDYLYNFIDLLIIDEAGQILPELAAASFALAKKAIVIGDTRQIEPIRSFTSQVDIGNLLNNQIISNDTIELEYERLSDIGTTSSTGSVMKVAQKCSRFHYRDEMERGMYLFEHRRCYNEIIHYCDLLCYDEKLILRRGPAPQPSETPAMGYLHIDGLCVRSGGGSRYNDLEAETIAAWIDENRTSLETRYKKHISEIVCVITPFGRQAHAITRACTEKNIKVGKQEKEMTVGTVHSIQGAERPVVIFSGVYSKHADGNFIDDKNSMLNVAVSRAKDHFLYFGDMDILSPLNRSKPRGLLAEQLFKKPENELTFQYQPRQDLLLNKRKLHQLRDATDHDEFLIKLIARAQHELHIVSPWIRWHCLEKTGALTLLEAAVNRSVKIVLYTDLEFNAPSELPKQAQSERSALFSLSDKLAKQGIELAILKRVHSKIVICDGKLLCVGSFNWFGAARAGRFARHETSLVYEGEHLKKEIDTLKKSLNSRRIKYTSPTNSTSNKMPIFS